MRSFVGWVRYLSQCWSLYQRGGTATCTCIAIEQLANLSDEVTEGRSSVRSEEERVEREGWIVNSEQLTETVGLRGLKCVIGERYCFVFDSFRYFEPVEFFENRGDVVVFWGFSDSTDESILNSLEAVYLSV